MRFLEKTPELFAYQASIVRAGGREMGGQYRREALVWKDLNWSVTDSCLYNEAGPGQFRDALTVSGRTIQGSSAHKTRRGLGMAGFQAPQHGLHQQGRPTPAGPQRSVDASTTGGATCHAADSATPARGAVASIRGSHAHRIRRGPTHAHPTSKCWSSQIVDSSKVGTTS